MRSASLFLSLGSFFCVASLLGCNTPDPDPSASLPSAPATPESSAAPHQGPAGSSGAGGGANVSGSSGAGNGAVVGPGGGQGAAGEQGLAGAAGEQGAAGTQAGAGGSEPGVAGSGGSAGGAAGASGEGSGAAGDGGSAGDGGAAGDGAGGDGGVAGEAGKAGVGGAVGVGGAAGEGAAGEPAAPVCEEGAIDGCFSAGFLSVCKGGQWGGQACPADAPVCLGGACWASIGGGSCLPEERRCQGGQPQVCDGSGVWVDGPACSAQEQLCTRGTCTQATGLALGTTHSCVRVAGGKGFCWGKIPKDDLATHNTLAPMELNDLGDLQQIAAGRFHTCMVNAGKVVCLGSNGAGELGQEGEEIPVFALPPVARVVVGHGFSCAATEGGAAYCWGARPGAPVSSSSATPVLVEGVDASGGLVAGTQHACALGAGGEVRCWGTNTSGQVGPQVGGQIETDPPVVPGLGEVLEIYAGPGGTCARSEEGLRCWGVVGPLGYLPEPTLLGLSPEVKGIAIGSKSLCIIDPQTDEVHCSNPGPAAGPILAMSKLDLGGKAREIAAGEDHACATLVDGRVVCWGANDSGQLGVGKLSPQEPPSLPAW